MPISGYAGGLDAVKFLVMPIGLSLLARLGTEARLYRAMFLEEIGKDYVRTARAKGLPEPVVLFRHVLKNALIPIITSAGSYLPYVFLGSLVFESFFGIPGLGAFVIEAIAGQDFAIVRSMVFLGAVLYIASYIADRPRLHLGRPAGPARLSDATMPQVRLPVDRRRRSGRCSLLLVWYVWRVRAQRQPARHLGQGAARSGRALRGDRAGAVRGGHDARQRPLPARAAARAGRRAGRADVLRADAPSRCSTLVLARPDRDRARPPTREPLAYQGFIKEPIERDGAGGARLPRLKFGGAHLADPDAQWAGDVARQGARRRWPAGSWWRRWRCCSPPS